MKTDGKLQRIAICSRVLVISLQHFSNLIIPDHDAGVFLYPKNEVKNTFMDKAVAHLLGGFVRWDAQYFMHIAKWGYTYENTLAFFPLYPVFVRLISQILYPILPLQNIDSVLLLVFVMLNIVLFVSTVKVLFKLSSIVLNESLAYKVAVLYCFNPASVFFVAPYTECMFSLLTFQSILNCLLIYKNYCSPQFRFSFFDIYYLLPIMLSTLVRSNGVLNIGFLAYTGICLCLKHCSNFRISLKLYYLIKYFCVIFMLCCLCLIPFLIFQIYSYKQFCTDFEINLPDVLVEYAEKNNFILPGQFSTYHQSWCYNMIPLSYSYVQNHYWNVGFLKYYELKQIPNFLLAAPALFIVLFYCLRCAKYNFNRHKLEIFSFDILFNKGQTVDIFNGPHLNVFIIHAMFLALFSIFFTHIQIATRMLCSATPVLYWASVSYMNNSQFNNFSIFSNTSFSELFIKIYFLIYFVVGTCLFSNFLPWT